MQNIWFFLKNTAIFLIQTSRLKFIFLCLLAGFLSSFSGIYWYQIQNQTTPLANWEALNYEEELERIHPTDYLTLQSGSTFAKLLLEANVVPEETYALSQSLSDSISLRALRAGTPVAITWEDEFHTRVLEVVVTLSKRLSAIVKKDSSGTWTSSTEELQTTFEEMAFYGDVTSSLWESGIQAKLEPTLIVELAEVFGWQIDFNREIRSGDRWRLLTQIEKTPDGEILSYGPILAAEYINQGDSFSAVRYTTEADDTSYFDLSGQSLKRMFLKSPIRFARITSRFQKRRFHPILKRIVPHNGVDYGAPTGTPIRSVGDGRVVYKARTRAGGNTIKVRHNSTFKTAYLHMSRYAKGIRKGSRIKQGQVIGYVGATGLATAPHLHFAFYENGKFKDPLGRKFPSKDPVPKKELASYKKVAQEVYDRLPPYPEDDSVSIASKPAE